MSQRPNPENTRKRPEAWHAQCLREEADALLDAILQMKSVQDPFPLVPYPADGADY